MAAFLRDFFVFFSFKNGFVCVSCLFVCLKEMLKINILWLVDLVGFGLFGSCPTYVYVYINC